MRKNREPVYAKGKIVEVAFFDELTTAPMGAVVIYKVKNLAYGLPLQNFFVVSFDDGSSEVPWGIGTTPDDALEVASREWDYLFATSPERERNPFREVIESLKGP